MCRRGWRHTVGVWCSVITCPWHPVCRRFAPWRRQRARACGDRVGAAAHAAATEPVLARLVGATHRAPVAGAIRLHSAAQTVMAPWRRAPQGGKIAALSRDVPVECRASTSSACLAGHAPPTHKSTDLSRRCLLPAVAARARVSARAGRLRCERVSGGARGAAAELVRARLAGATSRAPVLCAMRLVVTQRSAHSTHTHTQVAPWQPQVPHHAQVAAPTCTIIYTRAQVRGQTVWWPALRAHAKRRHAARVNRAAHANGNMGRGTGAFSELAYSLPACTTASQTPHAMSSSCTRAPVAVRTFPADAGFMHLPRVLVCAHAVCAGPGVGGGTPPEATACAMPLNAIDLITADGCPRQFVRERALALSTPRAPPPCSHPVRTCTLAQPSLRPRGGHLFYLSCSTVVDSFLLSCSNSSERNLQMHQPIIMGQSQKSKTVGSPFFELPMLKRFNIPLQSQ